MASGFGARKRDSASLAERRTAKILRFVRTKKEFEARIEYMRLNPVQKDLVARPEDWRWSGFPDSSEPVVRVDHIYLPDDYRA